jgi:hypothetical protein
MAAVVEVGRVIAHTAFYFFYSGFLSNIRKRTISIIFKEERLLCLDKS